MATTRRYLTVGAALVAVGMLLVTMPAGQATTTAPNAILRWASTNGGGQSQQTVTQAQAVTDAKNYTVIVALQKTFTPYLSAMRAANPSLKVLAYLNGTYAQSGQGPKTGAYPASWYEKTANGYYVTSDTFGNYLMVPTNPGWISNRAQTCASSIAQSGYDGCYLDMLGNESLNPTYVNNTPVNPATGQLWTYPAWMAATANLGSGVISANSGHMIVGNGLGNGNQYFDSTQGPTSKLIGPLAAANAQGFVRNENAAITQYRNLTRWQQDVSMLTDAASRGKSVLAMTKIGVSATSAQIQSWQRYALATFLMGTDGHQYFFFDPDGVDGAVAYDSPDFHAFVGMPSAAATAVTGGAYLRRFSSGLALVNPGSATVTVNLGGTYKDLDGVSRTSYTIAPNTGMVFTR